MEGAKAKLKVLTIALIVFACVAHAGAQPVDENSEVDRLVKLAQQWEDRSSDLLWSWTYDVYVWFTDRYVPNQDVYPKGAASRKGLEIQICKRGQQVVISGQFPTFGLPPSLASRLAQSYTQQFGAKQVHLPTEPIGGTVDILSMYEDKLGVEYTIPRPTTPPPHQSGAAMPPPPPMPVEIWKSATECRRQRNLSSTGEETLFITLLTMDNPLRLYTDAWQIATATSQTVTLEANSPAGWANTTLRVVLQKGSGRLLRYEILAGIPALPDIWTIRGFTTYSGIMVPAHVTRKRVVRFDDRWMHILYSFSLKSVSHAARCNFHLPLGSIVVDYRLAGNVTFENHAEPTVLQRAVQYRWSGSIPDEFNLRRMAYEQGKLPSAGRGLRATWALFVPGVLLLVVAIYLYRRMRPSV